MCFDVNWNFFNDRVLSRSVGLDRPVQSSNSLSEINNNCGIFFSHCACRHDFQVVLSRTRLSHAYLFVRNRIYQRDYQMLCNFFLYSPSISHDVFSILRFKFQFGQENGQTWRKWLYRRTGECGTAKVQIIKSKCVENRRRLFFRKSLILSERNRAGHFNLGWNGVNLNLRSFSNPVNIILASFNITKNHSNDSRSHSTEHSPSPPPTRIRNGCISDKNRFESRTKFLDRSRRFPRQKVKSNESRFKNWSNCCCRNVERTKGVNSVHRNAVFSNWDKFRIPQSSNSKFLSQKPEQIEWNRCPTSKLRSVLLFEATTETKQKKKKNRMQSSSQWIAALSKRMNSHFSVRIAEEKEEEKKRQQQTINDPLELHAVRCIIVGHFTDAVYSQHKLITFLARPAYVIMNDLIITTLIGKKLTRSCVKWRRYRSYASGMVTSHGRHVRCMRHRRKDEKSPDEGVFRCSATSPAPNAMHFTIF